MFVFVCTYIYQTFLNVCTLLSHQYNMLIKIIIKHFCRNIPTFPRASKTHTQSAQRRVQRCTHDPYSATSKGSSLTTRHMNTKIDQAFGILHACVMQQWTPCMHTRLCITVEDEVWLMSVFISEVRYSYVENAGIYSVYAELCSGVFFLLIYDARYCYHIIRWYYYCMYNQSSFLRIYNYNPNNLVQLWLYIIMIHYHQ